jgi:4-hydroxybenzoate polyprenyltransferase
MRPYEIFKVITVGVAFVVGVVMLATPGPAGPLVPWLVTGFLALVMAADFLEARADRDDETEETDR